VPSGQGGVLTDPFQRVDYTGLKYF